MSTRRAFLASAALLPSALAAQPGPRTRPPKRPRPAEKKVAVVASVYWYLSHAYHIAGRFLDGYMVGDAHHFPDFGVASCYVEQPTRNLAPELAREHGFRLAPTIEDALTLGTGRLAVDAVLLICEHGDYPYNARGQKLYPRHDYFQQIVRVFERSGKTVPVFCDKHLSYDRAKAADMVATAKKMGFGLMAGSSLPVTWRRPELELPLGSKLTDALLVSRGELEIYGIHALEALQCMAERRLPAGATEQGVAAVTGLQGDAVWKAGDDGLWSWELLEHAVGRCPSRNAGDIRANCRRFQRPAAWGHVVPGPIAFHVEYRDGFKATVLQLDGHVADEAFAGRIAGQPRPVSTLFYLPPPPGAAFLEALASHAERFVATGRPPYPAERTQLTGGVLDYALESRATGSRRLETPDLAIRYAAPADSGFMRGEYVRPVN
ncbi:hypothetical protein [Urbifossiella limnaea]|uniref:Gfo/Idh/MocA family oxidoreductase n=1 Tax=Urbifossiella limnaea TaxID=2528023 RepID=A0A517XLY9_9BACT|nr:hypothetical protein [Urbifossiella limnaea]QDU18527.1 hypothetical protein ETAA1_04170 [Urbifossiella limnaea]